MPGLPRKLPPRPTLQGSLPGVTAAVTSPRTQPSPSVAGSCSRPLRADVPTHALTGRRHYPQGTRANVIVCRDHYATMACLTVWRDSVITPASTERASGPRAAPRPAPPRGRTPQDAGLRGRLAALSPCVESASWVRHAPCALTCEGRGGGEAGERGGLSLLSVAGTFFSVWLKRLMHNEQVFIAGVCDIWSMTMEMGLGPRISIWSDLQSQCASGVKRFGARHSGVGTTGLQASKLFNQRDPRFSCF